MDRVEKREMAKAFDAFVGIDWSGAKGPRLPGLQVAECGPGRSAPILEPSPDHARWSRSGISEWILSRAQGNETVLIGIDFGFAYPYCDVGAYFSGSEDSPKDVFSLWERVESICGRERDFYGGPFYLREDALYADYLCFQTYTGRRFDNSRLRRTEARCAETSARPSCMFKCVGDGSVGVGSVAGTRLLCHLREKGRGKISIWPFESPDRCNLVVVEIFPQLFFRMANQQPGVEKLGAALEHFESDPLSRGTKVSTQDEADAVVSAAALRCLANRQDVWNPSGMDECARTYEGWIFGAV